jgi:uncharacterized membrane protein
MKKHNKRVKKNKIVIWRYLLYFIIFSFVGSLLEYLMGFLGGSGIGYDKAIYQFFNLKLYFIPFYGTGALILIFFEKFLEEKKIKFVYMGFLDGVLIVIMELIVGLLTLIFLDERFWNYSRQPFNFMGIISPEMFLAWIVAGYVFSLFYKHFIK